MDNFIISKNNFGKTVVANKTFLKGDLIVIFDGKLMHRSELPSSENILLPEDDRYLQVSEEYFIGPSGKVDDIINHSCDPNAGLIIKDKKARLIALRDIKIGDEITYDYSLQMYKEDWSMKCFCGFSNCRKVVREFKFLPLNLKKKYYDLGIVPDYNIKYLND